MIMSRRRSGLVTSRRRLLQRSALVAGGLGAGSLLPGRGFAQATVTSEAQRIQVPYGVQVGDMRPGRAVVWAKADRPGRMLVRWSTSDDLSGARDALPVNALEDTDFAGKLDLAGLPADQRISYEVRFLDLGDLQTLSQPVTGSFKTPPAEKRSVRFVWSGDTAGQGWGINPAFGGMRIYETMRAGGARFLHPFGRHDLCRWADPGRSGARRRQPLAERGDRGEGQGGGDAGRVPRQLRLQPAGRERPAVQRRGADAGAVGRPRGDQQLVLGDAQGRGRALQGGLGGVAGGPRHARLSRLHADADASAGEGPALFELSLRPARSSCSGSICAPIAAPTRTSSLPG